MRLTPPHNITNQKITDYLPKGKMSGELYEMMKKSNEILPSHPVNQRRDVYKRQPLIVTSAMPENGNTEIYQHSGL